MIMKKGLYFSILVYKQNLSEVIGMKSKIKMKFRIGVLCLIAMFMLIPLLSSPAAATVKYERISVRSNNSVGAGPFVVALGLPNHDPEGNYQVSDDTTGVIKFTCDCEQMDSKPTGQGSVHYMELNVQKIQPNPVGSLLTTYLYRELNPGQTGSPNPTPISITTNYTVLSPPPQFGEIFLVSVYAEVTDNATQNFAYNTFYWYIAII
jgi:hypothetical protein